MINILYYFSVTNSIAEIDKDTLLSKAIPFYNRKNLRTILFLYPLNSPICINKTMHFFNILAFLLDYIYI